MNTYIKAMKNIKYSISNSLNFATARLNYGGNSYAFFGTTRARVEAKVDAFIEGSYLTANDIKNFL